MFGTPMSGLCLPGDSGGIEEDLEDLLEPPLAVGEADVSGTNLPVGAVRIGEGLAHRDTS
jgi:hypothetical protein